MILLLLLFVTVAPLISVDPMSQNVTLLEGNITLSCETQGLPIPTIKWLHNGSISMNGQVSTEMLPSTNGIMSMLVIPMAMVNDSGNYVCEASSNIETTTSATAQVLVQSKY